jgi:hypothetical protein
MINNLQWFIKTSLLLGFLYGSLERTSVFMSDNVLVATEIAQLVLVALCLVGIMFLYIKD